MLLENQTVVVTGAAQGIGRAIAEVAGREGAKLVLGDVNQEALEVAVGELQAQGREVASAVCDVADETDCRRLVEAGVEAFGGINVLINNAAIGSYDQTVETVERPEWDRTLAVNLTSVFLMSKAAVPHLRQAGGGAIVNLASIHAEATSAGVAPYVAAKGGVLALTRNMAIDFAEDGIRTVAVLPGAVDTPLLRQHAAAEGLSVEELGFSWNEREIGHVGKPEEIAEVCVFVASERASFLTGESVRVDGGALARAF